MRFQSNFRKDSLSRTIIFLMIGIWFVHWITCSAFLHHVSNPAVSCHKLVKANVAVEGNIVLAENFDQSIEETGSPMEKCASDEQTVVHLPVLLAYLGIFLLFRYLPPSNSARILLIRWLKNWRQIKLPVSHCRRNLKSSCSPHAPPH